MDQCFLMYRDSSQELYREDYCKQVKGFISFALLNPKNISEGVIICPYMKCKNKKVSPIRYCDDVF